MKNNTVKFAIEDASKFVNDEDMEMGLARVLFLSTRPNSHGLIITEEVLKKYAPTVIGKWMIAEYDDYKKDVTTHTNSQVIIGNIPKEQEVEFLRAKDGYLDAYVDCVISKLYATKVYELFLSNNKRSVSVEMMTDAEDRKGLVNQFNITAITVLGLDFNPSCPNANIKMIRFSEEDANKFYKNLNNFDLKVFAKQRKNKLNSYSKQEEVKEEEMAVNKDKKEEVLEEKKDVDKKEDVVKKDPELSNKEEVKETKKMSDDGKEDKDEAKEEKMGCGEDKMEDLETMESLKAKLDDKEKIIMSYESELAELRKFKEDTMEEKKMAVVNSTLAKVKDKMAEEKYKEFSDKSKTCKFEEIDSWKNAVLASVTESFLKMSDENPDIMKFEIKKEEKQENKSLWDRL